MTISLVTTPGALNANSYVSLDEANFYFETSIWNDTWHNSDDNIKKACLIWATRTLDLYICWRGSVTTEDQALGLPRSGLVHKNGWAVEDDEIPVAVKNATCELAMRLIEENVVAKPDSEGIASFKIGEIFIEFEKKYKPQPITDFIWLMVKPYGYKSNQFNSIEIIRT